MKNWKKDLAQTILKTKVIFQFLETKQSWKMLNFYHYSPREKREVGKGKWLVSVNDFANIILKSRCIIKVSDSENCKYYSRLHQHEVYVSVGLEVVTNRRWGFFWFMNLQQVWHTLTSILVNDLKCQLPFACNNFSCKLLLLDFPTISFRVHKSISRTTSVLLASCPWMFLELFCWEPIHCVYASEGLGPPPPFLPYKHPKWMQPVSQWF